MFTPQLSILPPAQLRLWKELDQVPGDFVLYGGTALALHLGHRQSVDFDFFGSGEFDPAQLADAIPFLVAATVIQQSPHTLSVLVDRGGPVKLSFFGLPRLRRLRPPLVAPDNGLRIASLLDLAGTKAAVVQQRAEAKDYLDLEAMLKDGRINLPTALAAARAIHGPSYNPLLTLKALSYFADGNLDHLPKRTRELLAKAAGDVDLDRLPVVEADLLAGESAP